MKWGVKFMDAFIKKHEFNYINKCLMDLNNAFINCKDSNTVEASKAYIQNKIWNNFDNLNDGQKDILDISKITEPLHISIYLKKLDKYVYGMESVTAAQIQKVFKKEKKLKLPDLSIQSSKLVYLGWIDPSIRKLLIIYNLNGKLLGMACRLSDTNRSDTHICAICNHTGSSEEVAFVSPICKTSSKNLDAYKSLGFSICLDSKKCNERITSTEKLEKLIKEVNNIK